MEPLVKSRKLYKYFHDKKQRQTIKACDGVSLSVSRGRTLGLVGESGCGKTTVGRILLRLLDPDYGEVCFDGINLTRMKEKELRSLRNNFQMIFQDSDSSFNPRMRVYDTLKESIQLHNPMKSKQLKEYINFLISRVNLSRGVLYGFVGNLSGGEIKRLDVARALSIHPEFIIADEPLSLLDLSIQSQLANLFMEVQQEEDTAILYISHDLRMVEMLSHTVAVMYRGKVLELASRSDITDSPLHPYTIHLWDPMSYNFYVKFPESGCVYKNSCVLFQKKGFPLACSEKQPELKEVEKNHLVACHFAGQ
ncbi:MAG: ATP-binding cassette domain-containing protein [Spirochaetota bacterium]